MSDDPLVFNTIPEFEFATNVFRNVPVILQYNETPLIQVVNEIDAGFTTEFHIFHNDGTDLAKVKGSRLFLTDDGRKANLTLSHPAGMTVCREGKRVLFEIRRTDAAALQTSAELYTPDGNFLKAPNVPLTALGKDSHALSLGSPGVLLRNTFCGCGTGVHIRLSSPRPGKGEEVPGNGGMDSIRSMLQESGDEEALKVLDAGGFGLNTFEDCKIGIHVTSESGS